MTIREMLQQTALLTGAEFSGGRDTSWIEIRLPGGRRQRIFGRVTTVLGDRMGFLYTYVGRCTPEVDLRALLARNAVLRYARIALFDEEVIAVLVLFDLDRTSVRECAPMLQELAAVADELERSVFDADDQ